MQNKTRNQRKRERIQTVCMVFALLFLWMMLCTMLVKAFFEHPAEAPVNGIVYMETIGGESYGDLQVR
jgi:hypothetical protein